MHAIISKTGDIKNLEVISGPELLRQSALDAVGRWKYKPYLLNGEPTEVETTINVNYTFGGDGPQSPGRTPMQAEGGPPPEDFSAPEGSQRIASSVVAGMLISKVNPVYPPEAKAGHVSGAVVLHVLISKTGTVETLVPVSGPLMLRASAMDAVKQWTYKPYLLNGEPVEVDATVTVNYTFGEAGPQEPDAESGGVTSLRKIGGGVSAPMVIYQVAPEYSPEAKKVKFTGIVLVNLIVDENGLPQNVHVLRGVGMGLDDSAMAAVKQYRFKPAMEGGKPVPVELNIEVNFSPDGSAGLNVANPNVVSTGIGRKLPDGATVPVVIHQVDPEYTLEARKAKAGGVVLVRLTVDKQGRPQHVHVLRGVGYGLEKKAVDAVKEYRFKPAMKDDKPVEEVLNVEVNFQIF